MKSRRVYLLLTLSAWAGVGSAIPTSVFGQPASATVLADPIIEEPLRPLLQDNSGTTPNDPTACGLIGAATIPITLLLLQMLGLTETERRSSVFTQGHFTDDELK